MLAGHRRGHRRLRRQLLGRVPGARRPAGPVPQPAGQRQPGHRRRHGHQHPAAQPGRGHRRRRAPDRQPRGDARRPHAVRQGPRLPDRRAHHGPRRDHRRLPHRPGLDPAAGPRRDRRGHRPPARPHRRHRAAVPGRSSATASKIKELVESPQIEGIADVNDESAGGKTRLVIELKKDAPALVILNNLYKHTPLQTNFAVNTVALVDGVPRTLNLVQMLQAYIDHQVEVIRRRSQFRLDKARKRAHIVEGLLKALDIIDEIIAPIRASEDRAAARAGLMAEPFEFSRDQAEHILDMRLGQLTRLARIDLETELDELRQTHRRARGASSATRPGCARSSRTSWPRSGTRFADARRSEITYDIGDIDIEDLIDDEELVVTMSQRGYVKTVPADTFRSPGPRRPRRRRRQAARRRLRHPHPHHDRARLPAVLLQPGPGLPAQGARDPAEGPHGPRHRHRQPAAAAARRAHPGDHRHPRLRDATGTCSSPPARARSRRPSSTSTTRRCAAASSPSTCATTTSWCRSSRPTAATTSSWSPGRA